MTGMTTPQLYLAQVFTKHIDDRRELSATIDVLLRAFRLLWDRKVLRAASRAVGFVEVVPTGRGDAWNVHMHLIADAPVGSVDSTQLSDEWRSVIRGRAGSFLTDGAVRDPAAIATYVTKVASYSPAVGSLSLRWKRFYSLSMAVGSPSFAEHERKRNAGRGPGTNQGPRRLSWPTSPACVVRDRSAQMLARSISSESVLGPSRKCFRCR